MGGEWPSVSSNLRSNLQTGVIAQQLLFLPYHPSQPTELGFEVTHVLLAASMTAKLRDRNYGPPIDLSPRSANKSKLDRARPMVEAMFDPAWIADTSNSASLERWLQQSIVKRSEHISHTNANY